MKICIINQPDGYSKLLVKHPERTEINYEPQFNQGELITVYDFIQLFTKSQEKLREEFPKLKKFIRSSGMLWISWPKGACNMATDLNENIIRTIGLKNGMVDVKVISVDEVWSGLKFVYRLKDRV